MRWALASTLDVAASRVYHSPARSGIAWSIAVRSSARDMVSCRSSHRGGTPGRARCGIRGRPPLVTSVMPLMTPADVAIAAQLACLLEVSAPKPGNVSPGLHFHDVCYEDFLASAAAIGPAMAAAGERPLGATVRAAMEATARWTRSNTNLGLVLLLAPLARGALASSAGTPA